ncbi:MAG: bifunctional molybdenum cofactor biosynthesis protein MoaC/MoaB [Ignavibacteriales bacterium]|nr:bifunctional molybdenum cofactor biosynthesis protein MoaC/MoaB [Ignavibacteriales bacterium]
MRDISEKLSTVRTARARAILRVSPLTIRLLRADRLPKGNPLPVARVAAIQAAKNTSQIIPYCHPLPIEHVECLFEVGKDRIVVETLVKATYKTGVEMEALAAVSVAVLTLYDMMKIVDTTMEIQRIQLLQKTGGKSDIRKERKREYKAAVLVLSDSISRGKNRDESGKILVAGLREAGFRIVSVRVIPDDRRRIEAKLKEYADRQKVDLVMTSGGTGLGPRDVTPEATGAVVDREVEGISEFLRVNGRGRTPYSVLSRGRAGVRGMTLIVNVAGSPGAAKDAVRTLLPVLPHALMMMKGKSHRKRTR